VRPRLANARHECFRADARATAPPGSAPELDGRELPAPTTPTRPLRAAQASVSPASASTTGARPIHEREPCAPRRSHSGESTTLRRWRCRHRRSQPSTYHATATGKRLGPQLSLSPRPRIPQRLCGPGCRGTHKQFQHLADHPLLADASEKRQVVLDAVALATAVLLLEDVAGLRQVGDEAEGTALRDVERRHDIA
jgi:hypothetical protein